MQHGDLEVHYREELIVVLEGVLALISRSQVKTRRFRSPEITYHFQWHEVPLKRLIVTGERYLQYDIEIVTFMGDEVRDTAAEYLTAIEAPYSSITSWDYENFIGTLRFRPKVRSLYDSEPGRLDGYGQVGHAVVRGTDW